MEVYLEARILEENQTITAEGAAIRNMLGFRGVAQWRSHEGFY
jgi:hypothetical protein